MAPTEAERAAIGRFSKRIRAEGKARRELKAKTIRIYQDYIRNGVSDEEARANLLERLGDSGLTERKLKKYVENPAEISNPKASVLNEARILVWLDKQAVMIQEDLSHYDDVIEDIDEKFEAGEEWYAMEEVTTVGGKEDSIRTKRLPILEVKGIYLKRRAECLDRFFVAIRNLRGNQQIVNIKNTSGASMETMEDVAHRIKALETQHRIKDGVSNKEDTSEESG